MQRQRDGVWKRILALPLCACLLVSCSMRAVRVQNPVLSSGQEAPTVEPAIQSWESVAFIPVLSSVEVDLTTGETLSGRFRSADDREFVLEQDGLLRRVPRAEIQRVVLYQGRHTGRGTLWGFGSGAVIGLAATLSAEGSDTGGAFTVVFTAMFAGIGAGIGALIGTLVPEWTVIYEVP